ncbi:MAG: AsmA family protein [Alcaligenaceae bacterium]|nr:AsmA family protein [Alcaligenaceae bacterium]
MKKWLKRVLVSMVVLLLLAFVGGAVFLLTFDPNAYKYKIEEVVRSHYDRTLQINGDIELSLFPRIGLSVNQLSLSEPDSDEIFASIDSARFAVAIWPLISNRFVVDHVAVSGFKTWVVRDDEGSLNFEDLFEQKNTTTKVVSTRTADNTNNALLPSPQNTDFKIDIAGLELQNGEVYYKDGLNQVDMHLKNMTINTGRVTFDQPFDIALSAQLLGNKPVADAQLNIQGQLKLDPVTKLYSAQKLELALKGQLGSINASNATLRGSFNIDSFVHAITGTGMELLVAGTGMEGSSLKTLDLSVTAPKLNFDSSAPLLLLENFAFKGSAQNINNQAYEWSFESPALDISSTLAGGKPLLGFLRMKGQEQAGLNLSLKGISGSADNLKVAEVKIDGKYAQSNNRVVGLDISSPAQMNLIDRLVSLSAISGNVSFKDLEQEEQRVPVIGSLSSDFQKGKASFQIDAVVNAGKFNLDGELHNFSRPSINFDLSADSINLDQLLGPAQVAAVAKENVPGKPAEEAKAVNAAQSGNQKEAASAADAAVKKPAVGLKRELLQLLQGMGSINLKEMRYRGVVFNDVQAILNFNRGQLDMTSFRSWLFDGQIRANTTVDLINNEIKTNLELEAIDLQKMLPAFNWAPLLTGRSYIKLDLESKGDSEKMILDNIKGNIQVKSDDGVIKGADISQLLADPLTFIEADKTSYPFAFDIKASSPYSHLGFEAQFEKGIARLAALELNSELFAVQGTPNEMVFNWNNGDFMLPLVLKTRQPISISQNNITISVKELSFPAIIEKVGDNIAITLQWQKLKDSPLGKLLQQKKDAQEQAARERAETERLEQVAEENKEPESTKPADTAVADPDGENAQLPLPEASVPVSP